MFGAALRVSETLALRPSDLDLERGMVRVRHGKGDRARTVAIDPSAQAYVERWIAMRQALGLNGGSHCSARSPGTTGSGPPSTRPTCGGCSQACRPGRHRTSSPPACSSPFAGHRAGARREDVAGDQRPARALVDRGHRPLPTTDRPDRARRRGPRPRTPRVNSARETPPPALGGKRSGGSRARRGRGRAYPHHLIPIPRRGRVVRRVGVHAPARPGPPIFALRVGAPTHVALLVSGGLVSE